MTYIQEDRVFLIRNDEVLLFKKNEEYDGDDVNIEDFTKAEFLRYIGVKRFEDGIKQVFYYFATTNDLYYTQSGYWTEIKKAIYYPAKALTSGVLNDYIRNGQYDNEVRVGVKKGDEVTFTIVTE